MKLSDDQRTQLASDIASEFYKPDELCLKYLITRTDLERLEKDNAFSREVTEARRLLSSTSLDDLKVAARRYAVAAINTLAEIMLEPEAPTSSRVKAAERVLLFAGAAPGGSGQGEVQPTQLVIHTNLNFQDREVPGRYVIESKPIEYLSHDSDPVEDLI